MPVARPKFKSFRIHVAWLVLAWCAAPGPGVGAPSAEEHWAFRALQRVAPPTSPLRQGASRNPIDRFILAALETNGLTLAPRATQIQLIRRVTFGLIGLPPTLEEIDAFANDPAPDAYERLLDRLLASPHYGERWARHWLDLARFAESDGFEHDAPRLHSWRYRDYVIHSFNSDKPYSRFIQEQIAGDELWPADPAALVATGFNLLGPDMVDSADQVQRRHNTLNDMTDTAALVFLGLTLGCARCHDHKSEPLTQQDYYGLQAFFSPAQFQRDLPIPTTAERGTHEAAMADYIARTQSQQKQIDEIERPYRQNLYAEKLAKLSEEAQLAHRTSKEKRTVEMENQIQETAEQLKITDAELRQAMSVEDKTRQKALLLELKKTPKPAPLPVALALQKSNGLPARTFVLFRGDYNNPREEVQPSVPAVLGRNQENEAQQKSVIRHPPSAMDTPATQARRTALSRWIASPDNPLTARVMVNRLWQHHFGRGLVATPSDFGTRGAPPTHPQLLDWLAREFIERGWSLKTMHRIILLSATYQQSSEASPAALAQDAENHLFSRQNRTRLEGEIIRDSLLAISGQLNRQLGGPSVFPQSLPTSPRLQRTGPPAPTPRSTRAAVSTCLRGATCGSPFSKCSMRRTTISVARNARTAQRPRNR